MAILSWNGNLEARRAFRLGSLSFPENLQGKALLAAWQLLEGKPAGYDFPPNYGTNPADTGPTWEDRDGYALASFTNWWNANAKVPKLPFPTTKNEIAWSDLSQAHLAALTSWAAQKGVTATPGQLPSPPFPGQVPKPPAWPSTLPWPPPKPDWWPNGLEWPPVGVDWSGAPPDAWVPGLPFPPPVPGSSGYPYPWFTWPPNLWPIPSAAQSTPPPIVVTEPIPTAPPPVPTPGPGGTPVCPAGYSYDETSKQCQPTLPPAKKQTTTTASSSGNGALWVVGGLIALAVVGGLFVGRAKPPARQRENPSKERCRAIVSDTARTEYNAGYPQAQAVAIGYSKARKAGCKFPRRRRRK